MKVVVQRQWYTDKSTCGKLSLDDMFECYSLEPPVRQSPAKPRCIPAGTYTARKMMSPHFKTMTVWLIGVPGFSDIEIHPGNWPQDTKGCTVVGTSHAEDFVGGSRVAFEALMDKLPFQFDITYLDKEPNVIVNTAGNDPA